MRALAEAEQRQLYMSLAHAKGQIISEWNFGVFTSPEKAYQILDRFLPYEEARAEIFQKIGWLLGRFEDSEINWPLAAAAT